MPKVGIKDIAARAGVSIATVSHAFRNPDRVSDDTRRKVLAVAEEVGYSPNRLAASLRTARSGNIVAIIPDIGNSFNSGIIKAIESVAHERGYSVLLGDTQGTEAREREFAAMTRSRQADGIILMTHRLPFDPEGRRPLPPVVGVCEYTGCDRFPTVTIDDEQGAFDATRYLLDLGHRDIAVFTGDMATTSSRERVAGYRRAMQDAGLTVDERCVVHDEYSIEGGERAVAALFERDVRPTAIFCFSDELALGCMHALRERGFAVPDDVSVIGFDDISSARYFAPPLTTIAQPRGDIGRLSAALLFDLLGGDTDVRPGRRLLPHRLIERSTTTPAPRRLRKFRA